MLRDIDIKQLLNNINEMINTLEYDSMRSGGKAKLNSQSLVALYTLKDIYEKRNSKATPKKEVRVNG
jgi:hypothetical protein